MKFTPSQAINQSPASDRTHSYPQNMPIKPPLRRMKLTSREQEALRYMAAGYTSDEIARDLFISKMTVDCHRKNIIKKLGVTNVTAAVAYALRNNIIL